MDTTDSSLSTASSFSSDEDNPCATTATTGAKARTKTGAETVVSTERLGRVIANLSARATRSANKAKRYAKEEVDKLSQTVKDLRLDLLKEAVVTKTDIGYLIKDFITLTVSTEERIAELEKSRTETIELNLKLNEEVVSIVKNDIVTMKRDVERLTSELAIAKAALEVALTEVANLKSKLN